jgi:hypothetical protein
LARPLKLEKQPHAKEEAAGMPHCGFCEINLTRRANQGQNIIIAKHAGGPV